MKKASKMEFTAVGRSKQGLKQFRHEPTGIELVFVPGGSFDMGGDKHEDEKPIHKVTVTPFLLAQYTVTQQLWRQVMGTQPWQGKKYVREQDNCPATYISWQDAQFFCQKTGFCLPSEAQWEYACRAGTKTDYYWGDEIDGNYLWYSANAWDRQEPYAHPVGQKQPNPFGLYDMLGNIWEWCQDEWHDNYKGAPTDGSARDSDTATYRVHRSGSYGCEAGDCRCADRSGDLADYSDFHLGFRVALYPTAEFAIV